MNILTKKPKNLIIIAKYFLFFLLGKQASNLITILLHFFQFSKDNEQLTQKQISPLRSNEIFDLIIFFRQRIIIRKKGLFLHSLGVILDQFFVPEFHVSVDCTFEEVVVIIIISKGLNLEQMIEIGSALLFTIHAGDV